MIGQKPLGRTGRTISAIGLGCVTFGREIDEETSYRLMDHAVERGITFFDTAEAYGGGQSRQGRILSYNIKDKREVTGEMSSSERIIGSWMRLRSCREEITICSKVSTGGTGDNITRALTRSLDRLGTNYVNIYEMHSPDRNVPIEETLSAFSDEVAAGRVLTIGCSNYTSEQIKDSLSVSSAGNYQRFEVVQPPYNLVQREAESSLFPLCKRENISVTPYSPLGAGFLTGKYSGDLSKIPQGTRFHISPGHADIYFSDQNFDVVRELTRLSQEVNVPMTRLAMAWAMTHPSVTSVIVGARTTEHIDNAIEALAFELQDDLRQIMSSWSST